MSRVDAVVDTAAPTLPSTEDLAAAQAADAELEALLADPSSSSLSLFAVPVPGSDVTVLCDVAPGARPRPYVPASFRRSVFDALHNLSHPGVRASARLVTARFVWPSVQRDCRAWARACIPCQRAKVTRHVHAPVGDFATPTARFEHVHLDIIGPLPVSMGFRYCLTAVDRYTRWPEVWPLQTITTDAVLTAFAFMWIARFGVPVQVTTDRGAQFESHAFRTCLRRWGVKRVRTTSYHPAANGLVERLHRHLKAALMCHADEQWAEALPTVLLGLRAAYKEDIRCSPAELVYGEPLRLPADLLVPPPQSEPTLDLTTLLDRIRSHAARVRPVPASRHCTPGTFIFKDLAAARFVFLRDDRVRRSLQPPYTGPYEVLARDDKTLTLRVRGKGVRVSIDRVKAAYVQADDTPPPVPSSSPDDAVPGSSPAAARAVPSSSPDDAVPSSAPAEAGPPGAAAPAPDGPAAAGPLAVS